MLLHFAANRDTLLKTALKLSLLNGRFFYTLPAIPML